MRLIDADDLIEKIRRLPNAGIHWYVSAEAVFDTILNAPTIEPEQHWISCNERLPERYEKVLTTAKGDRVRENYLINAEHNEWCFDSYGVLAWCELPEPYKESE